MTQLQSKDAANSYHTRQQHDLRVHRVLRVTLQVSLWLMSRGQRQPVAHPWIFALSCMHHAGMLLLKCKCRQTGTT